jgi:hypothetical protein
MTPEPRILSTLRKRLSGRREAVTIALGFKCVDGIVLCADSLVVKGDRLGFYEAKLHYIHGPSWSVVTVYSGFKHPMVRVNSALEKEIKKLGQSVSVSAAREAFEAVLAGEHRKHRADLSYLETLCAISVAGEKQELLVSKGRMVSEANCECLGIGDSPLIRFLFTFAHPLVPMALPLADQSLLWGIAMIQQTKKYMPQNCGGETHAVKITDDGKIHVPFRSSKVESACDELLFEMSGLISCFLDPSLDELAFERECERSMAALKLLRSRPCN